MIVLVTLIALSLASLALGARGSVLGEGIRTVSSIAAVPFLAVFNTVESVVSYAVGITLDYDSAQERIKELERDVTLALQRTAEGEELSAENARLREMISFERSQPRLVLRPAEVIKHFQGVLTIDRGARHGMRESMCVLTRDGIVGMITQVDWFTSSVTTLQNASFGLDAMVKRNRVRGTLHGTGNDLGRICTMDYIDIKDDVRPGDKIVTSPDSVFPSGYPVGTVVAVEGRPGSLLKSVEVLPAADPFRIDEVFVLVSADTNPKDLSGIYGEVEHASTAGNAMETESLQERYAP